MKSTISATASATSEAMRIFFEEGGLVSKGDLLFIIDGRSFKSEVKRLNAQLKSARAQIDLAQRDVKRAKS